MTNSYTIKIKCLRMRINFRSKVHIEFDGIAITNTLTQNKQHYLDDGRNKIKLSNRENFIQLNIIITTDKGARYVGGVVKIGIQELVVKEKQTIRYNLQKCSDRQAWLQIQLLKVYQDFTQKQQVQYKEQQLKRVSSQSKISRVSFNYNFNDDINMNKNTNTNKNMDSGREQADSKQLVEQFKHNMKVKENIDKIQQLQEIISELKEQIDNIYESHQAQVMQNNERYEQTIQELKFELQQNNNIIYELQLQLNEQRMFKETQSLTSSELNHRKLLNKISQLSRINKMYEKYEAQAKEKIKITQKNMYVFKEQLKVQQEQSIKCRKQNIQMKEKITVIEEANEQVMEKLKTQNRQLSNIKNEHHKVKFQLQLKEKTFFSSHQSCLQKHKIHEKTISQNVEHIEQLQLQLKKYRKTVVEKEQQIGRLGQKQQLINVHNVQVQRQLGKANNYFQQCQDTIQTYKAKEQANISIISQLNNIIHKHQQQLTNIDNLITQNAHNQQQIQQLSTQNKAYSQEIHQLQQQYKDIQNKYKQLALFKQRQYYRANNICHQQFNDEEIQPVQALSQYYENIKYSLQQELQKHKFECNEFKHQLHYKNNQIQDIMHNIDTFENTIEEYIAKIQQMTKIVQEKDEQYEGLDKEHKQLIMIHEQYIYSFNRHKLDSQALNNTHNNEISELKKENQDMSIRIGQLQEINKFQLCKLQEQEIMSKELMKNELQIGRLVQDRQGMQLQQKVRTQELRNMQQQTIMQKEEILQLQKRYSNMQTVNAQLQEQNKEYKQNMVSIIQSKEQLVRENITYNKANSEYQIQIMNYKQYQQHAQRQTQEMQTTINEHKSKQKANKQEIKNNKQYIQQLEYKVKDMERKGSEERRKLVQSNQLYQQIEESKRKKIEMLNTKIQQQEEYGMAKEEQFHRKMRLVEDELQQIKLRNSTLQEDIKRVKKENKGYKMLEQEGKQEKGKLKQIMGEYKQKIQALQKQMMFLHKKYSGVDEQIKQKQQALFITNGKLNQVQQQFREYREKNCKKKRQYEETILALKQQRNHEANEENRSKSRYKVKRSSVAQVQSKG